MAKTIAAESGFTFEGYKRQKAEGQCRDAAIRPFGPIGCLGDGLKKRSFFSLSP
jgi:hypothetical protein